MWWRALLVLLVSILVMWGVLLVVLVVSRPDARSVRDGARVLPDTLRLVRRLAADRTVPRSARLWLWFLVAYLAVPFDLVPDFLPVIGYADDVIIASLVIRHLVRRAGPETVRRNWPGTREGLAALGRVVRLELAP
jgi:uncharacterized membrane protein YkvA (DUF1232 family)